MSGHFNFKKLLCGILLVIIISPAIASAGNVFPPQNVASCNDGDALVYKVNPATGDKWVECGSSAVPSGTICGMQTNDGNFGAKCKGYSPYNGKCPPGYWLNMWRVNFGSGWLMFCVKD
ncbi:MAG: hypothetical protein PHX43_09200 [Alphaproteobacteria bacterium]|nr:hypothetical protein [Alphaproteobacteria bacterium]